jgi:hypothetical protein
MQQVKPDVNVACRSESGIELQYPARLVRPAPWVGHIPFASWLVDALRPRVVVELGVHSGNSYCAFLQAVQHLALPAQCYGIDHWRGDDHSDYYGDEVYAELCAYHDPLYGTFSTLIRATFEDALPYFTDGSVDLLHLDGFHTYEAVAEDFSSWLPKMSARGVVLFHDINVRERDFGVWRFWEEIAARHPTFAFVHSHGLGVACVGSDSPPGSLESLVTMTDPDAISHVRSYFARLGTSIVDRFARGEAEAVAAGARASGALLDASREEVRRHVETVEALRLDVERATAHVTVLHGELATIRSEAARQIAAVATLQQELAAARDEADRHAQAAAMFQQDCATVRDEAARHNDAAARLQQELKAARAEAARHAESEATLQQERVVFRAEAARQGDAAARFQQELAASQADAARHADAAATLRQELAASRGETARQAEAAGALQRELAVSRAEATRQTAAADALQQQCSEARSELARHLQAAIGTATNDRHTAGRIAALEEELRAARAEIARHVHAVDASRATTEELTAQLDAVRADLVRARTQASDACAQRDRATHLLRQQIAVASALQRERAALRQPPDVAVPANQPPAVDDAASRPIAQYVKTRILGVRA